MGWSVENKLYKGSSILYGLNNQVDVVDGCIV